MKARTRIRFAVTSLLSAAAVCLSGCMVTAMQRAEGTGSAMQQVSRIDERLVLAQADPTEESLEDLVHLGQPEGKKPLRDCNQKAPSAKVEPKGDPHCTIQESAGKLREKPAVEAKDQDKK
jgi:hypothetical protein